MLLSAQICQARKEVAQSLALKAVGRDDAPIKNTHRACEQIDYFALEQLNKPKP